MGQHKARLYDGDGITPTPGKYVCPKCFDDEALQDFVRNHASSRFCSYCSQKSNRDIAAPFDAVAEHIFACLEERFQDAAHGVGWEGGFVGADTLGTWDLVENTVSFGGDDSEELNSDLVNALPSRIWSRKDPYGPRGQDVMKWSWDAFSHTVKHVRRFFFNDHLAPRELGSETVSPVELLELVASGCTQYGLVRQLPKGQRLYRCRSRAQNERFVRPSDMGPPPEKCASQSRMSPAGIPMFYGALDKMTAVAEGLPSPGPYAIAEFRTTRTIRVLDLTDLPYVSMFDPVLGNLDEWADFMGAFIRDFQRPVSADGEHHYEYVPTQIVTEYFRAGLGATGKIDGVKYRSVKKGGGVCVVLFTDNTDVDPIMDLAKSPDGAHLLKMRRVAHKNR
jgi:hypothetical protein